MAARLTISNFHSFCHRVLTEAGPEADLPPRPDVLDGIGQVLLLRDIRPAMPLVYHSGRSNPNWWLSSFVAFISRAKDELVTPDDFDAYVGRERAAFEARFGPIEPVFERLRAMGVLDQIKPARSAYADLRARERAEDPDGRPSGMAAIEQVEKMAEREARRAIGGTGGAIPMKHFDEVEQARIAAARRHVRRRRRRPRGAEARRARARLSSLRGGAAAARRARLRRAHRRGEPALRPPAEHPAALAAPVPLPPRRRVPGREHRPDRAHRAARSDAGSAGQRHGRRRRRPVDLPLPRRQLRGLRRVRRAVQPTAGARPERSRARAPRASPDRGEPPEPGPRPDRGEPPHRAQHAPVRGRQAAARDPTRQRADRDRRLRRTRRRGRRDRRPDRRPGRLGPRHDRRSRRCRGGASRSSIASIAIARRSSRGSATRASRTRSAAGSASSTRRRSGTSSRASGPSPIRCSRSPSSGC